MSHLGSVNIPRTHPSEETSSRTGTRDPGLEPELEPKPASTPTSTTQPLALEPMKLPANLTFGPFPITSTQAFHISPTHLSYALVNLRPLLPGHTLICPVRRVPRLSQLSDPETIDLFLTVKRVSRMLERVYDADALNVAVQDGVEAGQSVNHVHVHIIPRRRGDCEEGKGDEIYERMDGREGNLGRVWEEYCGLQGRRGLLEERKERDFGVDEEKRVNRSEEEMKREAEMLRGEMGRDLAGQDEDEMSGGSTG